MSLISPTLSANGQQQDPDVSQQIVNGLLRQMHNVITPNDRTITQRSAFDSQDLIDKSVDSIFINRIIHGYQVQVPHGPYHYFIHHVPGLTQSEAVAVSAWIYINRWVQKTGQQLTRYNIHRLMAASFLVAYKFYYDVAKLNEFYADLAGMLLTDLNRCERHFLREIDWDLQVTEEELQSAKQRLISHNYQLDGDFSQE